MNIIAFLKRLVLKIKENHYTKTETEELINEKIKDQIPGVIDGTSSVEVKNLKAYQDLTAKNLDLSYTAEDGITKKTGKVKSDVTPYNDATQNLGSSEKIWKTLYLLSDGFKMRTKIPDPNNPGKFLTIKPFAVDNEGNMQFYFPDGNNHKAITVSNNNQIIIYDPISKQKMLRLANGKIEIFGSINDLGYQKKSFSLNTDFHRLDFEDMTGVLSCFGEFIIIPDHGAFPKNYVETVEHDRIKIGGCEYTHFDEERDDYVQEDVIFSYKKGLTGTDDIPDIAITKAGTFYYKGKKLEDYSKLYLHTINLGNNYSCNDIVFSFYATRAKAFSSFEEVANYFLDTNVGRNNSNSSPNPFLNVISAIADYNVYPSISASAFFVRVNGQVFLRTSITSQIDTYIGDKYTTEIFNYSHDFTYETEEDAGYFRASCVEV